MKICNKKGAKKTSLFFCVSPLPQAGEKPTQFSTLSEFAIVLIINSIMFHKSPQKYVQIIEINKSYIQKINFN
jgi:hypothetical protein